MSIQTAIVLLVAASTPPPPPIVTVAAEGEQQLAMWLPGDVICDGDTPLAGGQIQRPFNSAVRGNGANLRPIVLIFSVDDTGRPHTIRRVQDGYQPAGDDATAALAASQFPAGRAFAQCRVTYAPQISGFDTAPFAEVVSFSLAAHGSKPPAAAWDRINGTSHCMKPPRPQQLVRVLPEFARIAGWRGARDWTLIGYDLGADGIPQGAHVVTGTGNAELDAGAVQATLESRFTAGKPRSGCLVPYWRNPLVLEAPPMTKVDTECSSDAAWDRPPVLRYPAAFQRRAVEGWAVVKYDIAPWGEIGSVVVVDAQPAADFGTAASTMLRNAKRTAQGNGATGCVTRVVYKMPAADG